MTLITVVTTGIISLRLKLDLTKDFEGKMIRIKSFLILSENKPLSCRLVLVCSLSQRIKIIHYTNAPVRGGSRSDSYRRRRSKTKASD
jgi:hypothetical protein